MKRLCLAACLVLVTAVAASNSQAAALQFKVKERAVSAIFSDVQGDGNCTTTEFWLVSAFSDRIQVGGKPLFQPGMFVAIFKSQVCVVEAECGDLLEFTPLIDIFSFAALPLGAVQVDNQLKSASVNAVIEAFDSVNNEPITLNVQLDAVGVGDTSQIRDNFQFTTTGFKFHGSFSGTFRSAEAVVSVTDTNGQEYTPQAPSFSDMAKVRSGWVNITH